MINKKQIKLILIILSMQFLISCGGGSGSTEDVITSDNKVIVVKCSTGTFTEIKNGDVLVQTENDTRVNIIHDSIAGKKVCTISGQANIIREGN